MRFRTRRAAARYSAQCRWRAAEQRAQAERDGGNVVFVIREGRAVQVAVKTGMKIGDLDPRADAAYCFTTSDKSLAIGGGVLEAVLAWRRRTS